MTTPHPTPAPNTAPAQALAEAPTPEPTREPAPEPAAFSGSSEPDGRIDPARTHLIVLRGNSASGKSSVARALRDSYGRGLAWVEQDHLRRVLLREHDRHGAANIGLIETATRYALDHGFHTVLEGILCSEHYGAMLARLHADYAARAHFYYLDVPLEETLRRHTTKPIADEVSPEQLRSWYQERDLLGGAVPERVLTADHGVAEMADAVLRGAGLAAAARG